MKNPPRTKRKKQIESKQMKKHWAFGFLKLQLVFKTSTETEST